MSLLTTVIDDKSPLISYDATWLPGTSQDDNYAVDYYLGTFQKNSATDGTATFNFNGTALWIYGANRPNHGIYTVQVDSTTHPGINGSGNNLFQQTLFSTTVSQGMHSVSLTNTDGSSGLYVDIDMIVWQSEVGSTGDQLVPEVVPDWDPRFQYEQSAWETTLSSSDISLNLFNNGTGHVTETSAASVSFTFTVSEAVTLFGTSGPSNGPYSVQLDGGQSVQYNATNAYPTNYGVTIYHADNLGPGAHQLVLTNLPDASSGQYLTIDYAQLWTVANSSNTSGTSNSPCITPSNNDLSSQNKLSSGAIAGLAVEGVVAIIAAAAALFFYLRWRAALAAPQTVYTPLYRSPETTTMTGTGIAPSLDAVSNSNSLRNNTPFQPVTTVGRSYQRGDSNGAVQDNMVASSPFDSHEGVSSSGVFLNAGQTLTPRPLPNARGGVLQPTGPAGDQEVSPFEGTNSLPPNYDMAVLSADA